MNEIRKVRANEITGMFREYDNIVKDTKNIGRFFVKKHITKYSWDELKESINSKGYQPKEYGYIRIKETKAYVGYTYRVLDGNHRMSVIEDLHGSNKFIDVEVYKGSKCGMCDKAIELARTKSGKLEIINILGTTTIFLIFFAKPTLIYMGFLLGFLIVLATNILGVGKNSRIMGLNKYGKFANLFLNTIINLPMVILSVVTLYFLYYIAFNNILGLICVGVFNYVMGILVDYYENK
tara:strand:+ start:711 stop:1421 length:711 start_codon:yes stop_codon:yes gene_type:complete